MSRADPHQGRLTWGAPPPLPTLPSAAALRLVEAAHQALPDREDLRLELVKQLFRARRPQAAVETAAPALTAASASPELLHWLGRAAWAAGDAPLALNALERAVAEGADAQSELAEARRRTGDDAGALALALARLDVDARDFIALSLASRILLEADRREHLWELCDSLLTRGAWGGYTPSAMAHAAGSARERELVSWLMGLDGWLEETSSPLQENILQEVARELASHPQAGALPLTNATQGEGVRIDDLQSVSGQAVAVALEAARRAVEAYLLARRHQDHPMIQDGAKHVDLKAWALSVRHDGHEDWHVHPDGWISGVLYIEVPHEARHDAEASGLIQFGALPLGRPIQPAYLEARTVRPKAGKLLLFPSHLGHRTWPTRSADRRTCIAFDVLQSKQATAAGATRSAGLGA